MIRASALIFLPSTAQEMVILTHQIITRSAIIYKRRLHIAPEPPDIQSGGFNFGQNGGEIMKKVKIDPATQQRPSSRKQQRNAKIRESLNQQVEVQVIPALEDMEGYEKRKPRVCAYCRVSTDMDTQALSYELQVQNYTEYTVCSSAL